MADVVGVAWVLLAAGAVLTPALVHGASLGPFDLLSRYGLTSQPGVRVHYTGPGDQIDALIPWTTLAWTQVHHGHLPLWNPYSGLGLPLAFNWQSSAFSVPALVGYLFPVRLAYTVAMVLTLVVAGTGVYVLGRMLRLGVLGCAMAGTAYELSGPVMGWLGWPNASAMSWAGWVFAAGLFVLRGRHRIGAVALFALVLAFCVYAGQPEAVVLLGGAFAVFLVVVLVRARRLDGGAPILRPLVDLALATAAGAALSAPLALPGLQVGSASDGAAVQSYGALRPHDLLHLVFQGFDGLPVAGNRWFGPSIYPETAAYVGVIALVLAATGLFLRRAQPEVLAFGAVALVTGIVAFAAPVVSVIDDIVGNRSVAWHRAVIETAFALAVLAGVGTDALARSWRERPVRAWLAGGFVVLAVVLVAVWTLGRGRLPRPRPSSVRGASCGRPWRRSSGWPPPALWPWQPGRGGDATVPREGEVWNPGYGWRRPCWCARPHSWSARGPHSSPRAPPSCPRPRAWSRFARRWAPRRSGSGRRRATPLPPWASCRTPTSATTSTSSPSTTL